MYSKGADVTKMPFADTMRANPLYRAQQANQQPASPQPLGFTPLKINPVGRAEPKTQSYGTPYSAPSSFPAPAPAVVKMPGYGMPANGGPQNMMWRDSDGDGVNDGDQSGPGMSRYGSLTMANRPSNAPSVTPQPVRLGVPGYEHGKEAYDRLMAVFQSRRDFQREIDERNRKKRQREADAQKEYWDNWNGGVVEPAPRRQGWRDETQPWPQSTFDGDPRGALAGVPPSQRPPAFQVSPAQTPWGASTDPFTERDALIRRLNEQRIARGVAMNRAGPVPPDTWGRMIQLDPASAMQGLGNLAPRPY